VSVMFPDPIASYAFFVEIDGLTVAQFKEVSGIGITIGVIEHRTNAMASGSVLPVVQKLPGAVHHEDIHLSRGKITDTAFWDWMKSVQQGNIDAARKDGAVVLYDFPRAEQTRFSFYGAWPYKVELGRMTAGADSILLENMILAVERIEVG
jgi:phage tail-like protein